MGAQEFLKSHATKNGRNGAHTLGGVHRLMEPKLNGYWTLVAPEPVSEKVNPS